MRDHLGQILATTPNAEQRNLAREYLQVYLLRLMHEAGAHRRLAFVGGTALRLLHRLPRFSEDLDFSAAPSRQQSEQWAPADLFRRLKVGLEKAGYRVTAKVRAPKTVSNAFFRFEGLPHEIGWSRDPRIALSVKVEIDMNPPGGADLETTLIQRFFPVALRHNDLPSLFAGKLHALLTRPYAKGRDWFDLVWYLTEKQGVEPNLRRLENALRQTGHVEMAARGWRDAVRERLRALNWEEVIADLRPFLERQSDVDHLSPYLVERLLSPT